MLRVAVPNKGALAESAAEMLREHARWCETGGAAASGVAPARRTRSATAAASGWSVWTMTRLTSARAIASRNSSAER